MKKYKACISKQINHWNMDGAFLGYQYIMNTIGQQSSIYKGKEIKKKTTLVHVRKINI